MNRTYLPLAFTLCAVACQAPDAQTPAPNASAPTPAAKAPIAAPAPSPEVVAAENTIDAKVIRAHVAKLASDEFEGRAPGTKGDELARNYIRDEFARLGLVPGAPDGSWMQSVPMLGIKTDVERTLSIQSPIGSVDFRAPDDFTAVAGSPAEAAAWNNAELVFVGYGIQAPEQNWDDFKNIDVKDKVLLVLNNDPSTDPELFAGKTRLYYGRWTYKFEEAARRGAAGAIIIHTTESAGYPFQVAQANHGKENYWLPFRDGQPTLPIRSWCSEDTARKLCLAGGKNLDDLTAAAQKRSFLPVPLGIRVSMAVRNHKREFQSANVLGKLPGQDPKLSSEHVFVTAHFDHLGRGKPRNGDEIYNGALDNASGVAGMLALVQAFAALPTKPARSIVFASVTGEESGLLGSEYLAKHLPCPTKQAIANINIDGLNIWGMTDDVEFIGYGKNSLTQLAESLAASQGRRLAPDSQPDLGLFYRSDHVNFARQGIPAAYLKAGSAFRDRPEDRKRMKASYTATQYHQPNDELADWWNLDGAVADLRLLFRMLLATSRDAAPTWTKGDEFEKLR